MREKQPFATFSDELASELADAGIEDAFLVTGGAIAPLTSAIAGQGRIRMHYMLTEQSAGIAAEAYGYFDNKPALLMVTSGPGVTNALTPVAAAWTNSSPVIVISGQARTGDVALAARTSSRQIGNQHPLKQRKLSLPYIGNPSVHAPDPYGSAFHRIYNEDHARKID